jgi:drug/metabolite transporter (DMT)-like permease
MKKEFVAHLCLIVESALYAGSYIVASDASDFISPFQLTLLRAIFATIIFGTAQLILVREKVETKDLLLLAACSLFGITVSNVLFFTGLNMTTPVNASLLTLTSPLFLILFAIVIRGEIEVGKLVGVLIASVGGIILIMGDTGLGSKPTNPLVGNLLVAVSAGAYAVYLTLIRPLLQKYHPLTILKWLFAFGMLYLLPVWGLGLTQIQWAKFTPNVWIALGFILICITFITFLLNTFSLKILDASIVSTYIYTTPLLTALIGVVIDGASFSVSLILASILILFGGFLVSQTNEETIEEAEEIYPDSTVLGDI